jgi:hypothetical protein
VVSIFLGLGMSILSASFASFLVAERMNNAKHLQVCTCMLHSLCSAHMRTAPQTYRTHSRPSLRDIEVENWVEEPVAVSRQ